MPIPTRGFREVRFALWTIPFCLLAIAGCSDEPPPIDETSPSPEPSTPTPATPVGPRLSFAPESLDFGRVELADSVTQELSLENTGDQPLELALLIFKDESGVFALESAASLTLSASEQHDARLVFTPSEGLLYSSELVISSNDPQTAEVTIPLSGEGVAPLDDDADGFDITTDCDDQNADSYPGAPELCDTRDNDCDGTADNGNYTEEVCDGADNNCDGQIDEGTRLTSYADSDGDGYGDEASELSACTVPEGAVLNADDCDDTRAEVYPGALEYCDEIDTNCNGVLDDEAVDATAYYPDADTDGYGTALTFTASCSPVEGAVTQAGDCDDTDPSFNPGAAESCTDTLDYNCDGSTAYADSDQDGVPACQDCDDSNAAANPSAAEVCDGADNNCNGQIDEDKTLVYYQDADLDGYGVPDKSVTACAAPPGYTDNADDCNDTTAAANPSATERCDGIDNNCDLNVDENSSVDAVTWYPDADGDGYGISSPTQVACAAPAQHAAQSGDCNDSNSSIYPGAPEACTDTVDLNCDGSIAYSDADQDGFPACQDCDDARPDVNSSATETCDDVDNDCDGTSDEGVTTRFYLDQDGDGFGNPSASVNACSLPAGYASNSSDCNDNNAQVYPGASESCNSIDDDCDGQADEANASGCRLSYADQDGDTWGSSQSQCLCAVPVGSVTRSGDCDDANPQVYPGQTEKCNGIDDDCDLDKDEANAQGCSRLYSDVDDDGYGTSSDYQCLCDAEDAYTAEVGGDCLDSDASVYPNGTEVCDGKDNNCNGQLDEGVTSTFYIDDDGDGYGATYNSVQACTAPSGYVKRGGDCNDFNAAISPAATEQCNQQDDNCNGTIDDGLASTTVYVDLDNDGFGAKNSTGKKSCLIDANGDGTPETAPDGYSLKNTDCNDSDSTVYPGASELCDGLDNNCDTFADTQCPSDCPGTWPVSLSIPGHAPVRVLDRDGDTIEEIYVIDSSGKLNVVSPQGTRTALCSSLTFYTGYGGKFTFTVNPQLGSWYRYYMVQGTRIYNLDTCTEVFPSANDVPGYGGTGDFDGDQKLDYAGHYENSATLCVKLSSLNYSTVCTNSPNGKGYDAYLTTFDLEGDGRHELLVPRGAPYPAGGSNYDGSLDVYGVNGTTLTLKDSVPPSTTASTNSHMSGVDWADYFNDGFTRKTVLFNGKVIDLNTKGLVGTWSASTVPNPRTFDVDRNNLLDGVRQGVLVDLDYDLIPESIQASGTQIAVVKNTSGNPVMDGWPVSVGTVSWSVSPLAGDVDNDGRLEFYVPSSGALYCYRLGKGSANFTNIIERGEPEWINRTMSKDPYEPNGSNAQSWPLRFPTKELRALLTKGDVDFYRLPANSGIFVQLYSPSGLDFDLQWTDSTGTRIYGTSTNGAGQLDQVTSCPGCQGETPPAYYLVKVFPKNPSADFSNVRPYVLKINALP